MKRFVIIILPGFALRFLLSAASPPINTPVGNFPIEITDRPGFSYASLTRSFLFAGHLSECRMSGPEFFLAVMRQTDTVVSWPERLKIGSKSKKDPQVKIEGLPINVGVAKEMIMQVLDVKKDQVTLRMDISYTDHSHLIGKKGETIQKVKSDTDCHIHFPDSNRNGVVKSNRVTLTGMAENVERAKLAIRKLMPIVLKLLIPSRCLNEKNQTVFSDILRSIRERHLSFKFNPPADSIRILVIRGQRAEKEKFEEILGNIDRLVASNRQDEIAMEIEMAISHNNNFFKKDLPNNPILNRIMQSTNTTIKMLFLNQNNDVTKSTIHILGRKFENVYKGWQEVMDHLPLSVEFSVDANRIIDTVTLNRLFQVLNISINIKSKTRHTEKTVIITSYEKFSKILFEIRKYLLNEKILSIQIPDMLQRNSIEYSRNLNEALLRLEKSTGYHTNLQLNNYAPTMLYSSNFYPDIWSTQPYLPVSPDSTPDTSPRNSPLSNLSDNKEDTFGSVVRNSVQDNSNYIHVCTNIWCNHEKCIKLDMDKLESEFDTIWRNGQSSTSEIKNHNSGNNRENLNGREIKQFDYGLKMWAFNAMKQNPVGSQKRRPTNFWCGGGFSKSMYDVHYPSIPSYICPFQLRRVERDSKSKQTQSSVGLTSHKGDNFFSTSNCFESLSQKPVLSANQDIKDLSHLLTNLNLERYMNNFLFHEIDLSAFLTLNEKDLKELGVSKSARDKMLFAISDLNERRNLRESSPDPASRPGTEPLLLRLARQRPSPVLGDP